MNKSRSPRKGAFSLTAEALTAALHSNSWTAFENVFRKHGIITEGYNPDRDVYERVYHVGKRRFVRDLHSFGGKAPSTKWLGHQREKIEARRPGVVVVFDNLADLQKRLHKLAEHPGYSVAPSAPFILTNKATGIHKLMPPTFAESARQMRVSTGFGALAA